MRRGAHVSVVGTAIPQGVDAKSECLGPVAMRSGEEVALFTKVVMMVRMGLLVVVRMLLLLSLVMMTHGVTGGCFGGGLSSAVAGTSVAGITLEFRRCTSRNILVGS